MASSDASGTRVKESLNQFWDRFFETYCFLKHIQRKIMIITYTGTTSHCCSFIQLCRFHHFIHYYEGKCASLTSINAKTSCFLGEMHVVVISVVSYSNVKSNVLCLICQSV